MVVNKSAGFWVIVVVDYEELDVRVARVGRRKHRSKYTLFQKSVNAIFSEHAFHYEGLLQGGEILY